MTAEELKRITDQLARIYTLYECTFQLMSEHTPEAIILEHINGQFRSLLDDLDLRGVMS